MARLAQNPTADQMAIDRLSDRIAELEQFDVEMVTGSNNPVLAGYSAAIQDTLERSFGPWPAFQRYQEAYDLNWYSVVRRSGYPTQQTYVVGHRKKIETALVMLRQARRAIEENKRDREAATPEAGEPELPTATNKVFVVHGHDHGMRDALARFLARLGLQPVILDEQANEGRTIIEKFERFAGEVSFATVLVTPDDVGSAQGTTAAQARARQNVLFELGFFAGSLRRGKVCLLVRGQVEMPSDLHGVVYISIDDNEGWQLKLGRELHAAGLPFDPSKLLG